MDIITRVSRRTLVFPLACVAALAMLVISESAYWNSVRTLNQLGVMVAASRVTQGLHQSILDSETGQRGYLLTGRPENLQPYDKALQEIATAFGFLDTYYAGQTAATNTLDKLHTVTAAKLAQMEQTIHRRGVLADPAASGIELNDLGREQIYAIRRLGEELQAYEEHRVMTGRDDLFQSLLVGRIGVAALSVASLLALFFYLRQTAALKQNQLVLKRTVQAERDRLDIEVRSRTVQLTQLTHHLQTAREDERHRLARNLHDELGALLTSAKLDAARIRARLAGSSPEALERLAHLVDSLNQGIALGRSIIEDLRPSTLGNLGLGATLEILAREFAERSSAEVICALKPVNLDAAAELMVYRLVQEAITNISKYAKAQQVWICLASHEGMVEVSVRDDGIGFDPAAAPPSTYGLMGMRYRVEAEGGTLAVQSAPGQGTLLRVRLPESATAKPAS